MIENPRLRILVGRNGRLIAVALVALALVAFAGAGTTYANPPTEKRSFDTHQRTVTTTTGSSIVVTGNDTVWENGTVLRNQPVYLRTASERLNLSAETAVQGTDSANITHEWFLRIRVTQNAELYSEVHPLANATSEATTLRTNTTVNVTDVERDVANVTAGLNNVGSVSVTFVLSVSYRTDPGTDYGYANTTNVTMPFGSGEKTFSVGADRSVSKRHARQATTTETGEREWLRIYAMALGGLVALAGAGAVIRERPAEIDVTAARHELHRRQYEQWISPGIIPIMGMNQEFVELDSLEDVVDVAIDTNERVVYDDRRNLYAVISENVVYYYSTTGSWMETAFPGMDVPPGSAGGGPGGPGGEGPFDDAFDFPGGDGGDEVPDFAGGVEPDPDGPFGGSPSGGESVFDDLDGESGGDGPFDGGADGDTPFGDFDEGDEGDGGE